MASIGDRILDAFVLALQAPAAGSMSRPAGLSVQRLLAVPLEDGSLPAILVYPSAETSSTYDSLRELHELTVVLDLRTLVSDGVASDAALDPLYLWSVRALKEDESLGGLAVQIQKGARAWDNEVLDKTRARLIQEWTVQYVAREFDPENN